MMIAHDPTGPVHGPQRGAPGAASFSLPLRQALRERVLPLVLPRRLLVFRGPARGRQVALTFDDGPDALTGRYLDLLDDLRVPATFFLVGKQVAAQRRALLEYVRRGHEVAAHGYHHLRFPRLPVSLLHEELIQTDALLLPTPARMPLVRPPFGDISPRSVLQCAVAGFTTVMWSLDSLDYKLHDGARLAAHMAAQPIAGGEIVLLHEGQEWTLAALPGIVADLRARGFTMVTVSQMLGTLGP